MQVLFIESFRIIFSLPEIKPFPLESNHLSSKKSPQCNLRMFSPKIQFKCSQLKVYRKHAPTKITRGQGFYLFCVFLPWVSSKCRVVKGVETVVVGDHDVGGVIQQQCQHVVTLLRNGVVQRGVTFRVLQIMDTQTQVWPLTQFFFCFLFVKTH